VDPNKEGAQARAKAGKLAKAGRTLRVTPLANSKNDKSTASVAQAS